MEQVYKPIVAIVRLTRVSCMFRTYGNFKTGQSVWDHSLTVYELVYKQIMCYSKQQLIDIEWDLSHPIIPSATYFKLKSLGIFNKHRRKNGGKIKVRQRGIITGIKWNNFIYSTITADSHAAGDVRIATVNASSIWNKTEQFLEYIIHSGIHSSIWEYVGPLDHISVQ